MDYCKYACIDCGNRIPLPMYVEPEGLPWEDAPRAGFLRLHYGARRRCDECAAAVLARRQAEKSYKRQVIRAQNGSLKRGGASE